MRNPFLLGLFDSLTHTDHHTAPLDVRTVLREHGGLQAFQSAADPDRWLAAVEHDLDERIRGRDRWIRDYTIGMKTANILKVLLPPLILGCIAQPSETPTERSHTYINHGEIIEFSHYIFENDDVVEEIYGVGYTDGIDSIAMRDWRGVGRDASLTMSAHITDTDIRRAVRQARQTAERHAPEYDGQPLALDYVELRSNSKDDPHIIAHYKPVIEKPGFHPVENARIQAFNKRLQPATIGLKPEDHAAFQLHTKEN